MNNFQNSLVCDDEVIIQPHISNVVLFFHFYSTLLCSGKSGKNSFIAHKQKEGLSCTMHIIAQITLNTVRLFLLAPKISSHKKEIVTRENIFWLFCVESIWVLVKLKKIKRKMAELIKSNPMESPLMIKSLMENVGKNKKAILMITKKLKYRMK